MPAPAYSPILAPVVALALWTHVIWAWMYATRLPAIRKAKLVLDPSAPRGAQMATLPATVRWKADNYNHLMEQPTVFYAVALSLALLGQGGGTNLALAWGYVALRIVHSVIQTTMNRIEVRFSAFDAVQRDPDHDEPHRSAIQCLRLVVAGPDCAHRERGALCVVSVPLPGLGEPSSR